MEFGAYFLIGSLIWVVGGILLLALWAAVAAYERVGLLLLALLMTAAYFVTGITYEISATKSTAKTVDIHIKDKERVQDGKTSRYLVYTDNEVFENTDAFFTFGKTNSSDLYGKLEIGRGYTCKVAGWRVHFFSAYRNLIDCKE